MKTLASGLTPEKDVPFAIVSTLISESDFFTTPSQIRVVFAGQKNVSH